ncbi:MAG: MBL fold metallo-hydrolase [Gammaproteobacteria bacterium]|nr:MBL fold metallo-hydrolase [Gammaproteobacteria bacterium]
MTAFASLGSGSKGNGTLVRMGSEHILVDCGFSTKQAEKRLRRLGVAPGSLSAILVTHEHSDHSAGVAALAYKYALPVFASYGTLKALEPKLVGTVIDSHKGFSVGEVEVIPVIVPHDTREPTQFVFEHRGVRVGVLSDLGQITPHVIERYTGCHGLLMEANHDRQMLMRGRYPEYVKRRIASNFGHLSNEQAVAFLSAVANPLLQVVVGHVSEENNHHDLLEACFAPLRSKVRELRYANQSDGVTWVEIAADAGNAVSVSPEYAIPAR